MAATEADSAPLQIGQKRGIVKVPAAKVTLWLMNMEWEDFRNAVPYKGLVGTDPTSASRLGQGKAFRVRYTVD